MKMKTNKKQIGQFLLLTMMLLALLCFSEHSFAISTLDEAADNITQKSASFVKVLLGFSFIMGVVFGAAAFFKLREHANNPQVKLSTIGILTIASAGLIGLPTYITLTTNTFFGTSHDSSDTSGSNYDRIR